MTQPRRKRSASASANPGQSGSPRLLMGLRPVATIPVTPAVRTQQLRAPSYKYAQRPATGLPVQNVVDRSAMLDPFLVDIEIFSKGRLIETLRVPEFGPSAPLPSDPARFSRRGQQRNAARTALAPVVAARRVARGGAR